MAGRPRKQIRDKTYIAKQLEKLLDGKSFSEFERINSLPERTMQRIMNGNDPRLSTLSMIARACNVTLDYFYEGGTDAVSDGEPETAGQVAYRDVVIHFLSVQEEISGLTRGIVAAGFSGEMVEQSDLRERIQRLQDAISRLKSAAGMRDREHGRADVS